MNNEKKKNKKTSTVAKATTKAKSTAGANKTANKKPATKPAKQTKTAPKAKATKPAKKVETKKAIKRAEPKSNKKQAVKEIILMKNGLDKEGNQQYKEIKVYQRKPSGWKDIEGATTAPVGFKWISNGESLFSGKRRSALLKVK